jgi:DNA-binding MarR family transcriptional regulator
LPSPMTCSPIHAPPARGLPLPSSARAELEIRTEFIKRGLAKTMRYGRASSEAHPNRAGRAALAVSGALSSLAGFVLALGGDLSPEGSASDVLAGLGLIVSGFLLSLKHPAGTWTYTLVFAGAVGWSLRNIEGSSSPVHPTIGSRAASNRAPGTRPPLLHPASERLIERTSAMMYDWQTSLRASDHYAARILPPATVEETGWDILLALHSDRQWRVSLQKLASIVSVPQATIDRWLGALEERKLITGARDPSTDELLAVLTESGRGLLDRYFSATKDLQASAHS